MKLSNVIANMKNQNNDPEKALALSGLTGLKYSGHNEVRLDKGQVINRLYEFLNEDGIITAQIDNFGKIWDSAVTFRNQ